MKMLKITNKKRIKIVMLILITIFVIMYIPQKYIWGSYVPYTKRIFEPTQISEIDNMSFLLYEESGVIYIEKQYMIIKPPKDLKELKLLIEKYNNENPINLHMVKDEIKNRYNITDNDIKKTTVYIRFYKEKNGFPRDWQETGGGLSAADRLEHHGDACIASIVYTDIEIGKKYHVMKKRRNGDMIEEMEYINDKIIKHEINEVD